MVRLHVNIDHVATLRQARRGLEPDPVAWALAAEAAGADGITCHLRKDRRHIQDADVVQLRARIGTLLNLESSLDPEMVAIAEASGAEAFCLVPENRKEVTTEGGLDVLGERARLSDAIPRLVAVGGAVSLFIDPEPEQIRASADSGATFIELHTGSYANASGEQRAAELRRLSEGASLALELGLRVNAGHGLNYENVGPCAKLPGIEELNIGHSIVSRATFGGVAEAIATMRALIAGA
ncbi:MAG: pyridoxine 5'-phosphate synthase [Planctomycetota bacterium]|nr:pyridoxine 5'-phosphate synthase [Planctomycetota bacterium]